MISSLIKPVFKSTKAIGYDVDYTLVQYNTKNLLKLIY
jgi:hypothetical protein